LRIIRDKVWSTCVDPEPDSEWATKENTVIQEFKDFLNKGNVFDAAIGLIMALAFVPVVNSLVADVIMPIVARIFGAPDFASLKIDLGGESETLADGTTREAAIYYGAFLNTVITFVIIALIVFLMVKAYNRAMKVKEEDDGPSEVDLLTEIRDGLKART
jgi:large conductance mechanosensitive channel